jgi:hypothetical protein
MLAAGDMIPAIDVRSTPRETVTLPQLLVDGPILLFFYLFDWSGT